MISNLKLSNDKIGNFVRTRSKVFTWAPCYGAVMCSQEVQLFFWVCGRDPLERYNHKDETSSTLASSKKLTPDQKLQPPGQ